MNEVPEALVALLDALEARLPQLITETWPGELPGVFAAEAEAIADVAGDEHASYVAARLQAMAAGLPLG